DPEFYAGGRGWLAAPLMTGRSAAADGADDLETIAARHRRARIEAARHDLAVALDRDPLARKSQCVHELGDRGSVVRHLGGDTVQHQRQHRLVSFGIDASPVA